MTWREEIAPIVAAAIARGRAAGEDRFTLRRRLRSSWPSDLGPRKFWPYKVWLDEIRRQLDGAPAVSREPRPRLVQDVPGQGFLFGEPVQ